MKPSVQPGTVLHWTDLNFADGTSKNKYLVVLGAKPRHNWLAAIATSQKKRKTYTPGCHAEEGYYHVPGGSKDFFTKDTWLLLMECVEIDPTGAQSRLKSGELKISAHLRRPVADAIRECLRQIRDVSSAQLKLL